MLPIQGDLPGMPRPGHTPFHTTNPREIRLILALARSPQTREALDQIAGASNVPDAIASLRNRGLEIPCSREPVADRDRRVVYRGRYALTPSDRERTRLIWEGVEHE